MQLLFDLLLIFSLSYLILRIKFLSIFLGICAFVCGVPFAFIRKYDFYTMLWVLLVVLVVFYIIGDVVRYIYASIKPRIIPSVDDEITFPAAGAGNVVERDEDKLGEEPEKDYNEDEAEQEEYDASQEYEDSAEENLPKIEANRKEIKSQKEQSINELNEAVMASPEDAAKLITSFIRD